MESNSLAMRATVRDLVSAFQRAEMAVRVHFAAIVEAEKALNLAFAIGPDGYQFRIDASGQCQDSFDRPEETIARMRRKAWRNIVERLELRRVMSIQAWNLLDRQLDTEDLGPFTVEAVERFAAGYFAKGRSMLQEAVEEIFNWLRPHANTTVGQLKTNTEMEIGERVILGSVVRRWFGTWQVNNYARQRLIALENVFNGLAGDGEICKGYYSQLQTEIEKRETAESGEGETALFAFRACKNGNLHLRFKRLDLLAQFNALAGGKTLRPAETEEEKLKREVAHARADNARLKREAARRDSKAA